MFLNCHWQLLESRTWLWQTGLFQSRKSALPKPLLLSSICQHPGSKITSEDLRAQKLKDNKPGTKIPVFSTEKKWKLRLWNYYAIKQLGMPFSPFPRIFQIWLKSQTSSRKSNEWYVKEGNTDSNRATNSPAGHEKGHVFPLKQILTALCYSLCGSFLRPIPVGPAESREYMSHFSCIDFKVRQKLGALKKPSENKAM